MEHYMLLLSGGKGIYTAYCRYLLLLIYALALVIGINQAPAHAKPLDQYSAHVWRMQDGLPQNVVKSIAQMPDGYIWIGTQEGLARFDGVRFTVYTTRNTPGLASDNVHYLLVDRPGNLWILAGGGLSRYKSGVFTKYINAGAQTDSVLHIWIDRFGALMVACEYSIRRFENGELRTIATVEGISPRNTSYYTPPTSDSTDAVWFVDKNNDVACARDGRVSTYPAVDAFTRSSARGLCVDAHDNVWAAGDRGLFRIDPQGPVLYAPVAQFGGHVITQLSADAEGNVWILADNLLFRLAAGKIERCGATINCPGFVNSLLIDPTGVCWLTTRKPHELFKFTHGSFEECLTPEDVTQAWEPSMMEDNSGDIWIGTVAGVCCLQDLPSRTYTTNDGLAESNVRSVCFDHAGRLWVGTTHNGASIMVGSHFIRPDDPRLRQGSIGMMASSPNGDFWIDCDNRLYRVRGKTTDDMTSAILGSQPGNSLQSFATDTKGTLWLGTSDGLIEYDGASPRRFSQRDGCPTGFLPLVYPDRFGAIWIGANESLSRFKNGQFTTYTPKDGLPSVPIISMYVDEQGVGWIGSWGEGLYRLRDGKISRIAVKDGLTANSVQQILADNRGYLWIGSSKGVFRVRRATLDRFILGVDPSVTCDEYNDDDGATGGVTSQGNQPSGTIDSHGVLWFATMKGLERIVPEPLVRRAAPILIEQATIDRTAYGTNTSAVAPPGSGVVEIEYTALTYRASHQVSFSYRLDGYDKTWEPVGTRRVAYYTNLPPGKYRFVVQAFDREGARFGAPAVFTFELRPHFWETVWFHVLCYALFVLIAVASAFVWTRSLRLRNQELDRKVAERTAELQQAYEELSNVQAELEMQNESLAEANERLEALATEDGLTGLKNHRSFQEQLEQQFLYAKRYECDLSLLLLDVDNFKSFNDTFGHPVGDQVLREVAQALSGCARETDVVARYGGEEFVIVLPHTGYTGALEMAERCRQRVEAITGLPRQITGSFGVTTITGAIETQSTLTEQADNALYFSKKNGKNRVTHFADLDRERKAA
jgi:diguanylate cyclase (GGDEF)-like protein